MKNYFLNFIIKILGTKRITEAIDIDKFNAKIAANKISKCNIYITKGKGSRFYEEANVINLQSDNTKIIIGDNSHIRGQLLLFKYGGKIQIGNNCFVGEGSRIWSGESVTLGDNILISHNVSIIDNNAHEINHVERINRYKDLVEKGHWNTKGNIQTQSVKIKDYAWISFNATILKGVTIGEGAIVAAGAVVTKDVPDFTMVAGNPAVHIKSIKNA